MQAKNTVKTTKLTHAVILCICFNLQTIIILNFDGTVYILELIGIFWSYHSNSSMC